MQRFGRDAVSLLAVTLSQYIAGEVSCVTKADPTSCFLRAGADPCIRVISQCTANDFYDMAFDILQGDSEVRKFVSPLHVQFSRRHVEALTSHLLSTGADVFHHALSAGKTRRCARPHPWRKSRSCGVACCSEWSSASTAARTAAVSARVQSHPGCATRRMLRLRPR